MTDYKDPNRIDTGELEMVHPDSVADVTDESVAEETLVLNTEEEVLSVNEEHIVDEDSNVEEETFETEGGTVFENVEPEEQIIIENDEEFTPDTEPSTEFEQDETTEPENEYEPEESEYTTVDDEADEEPFAYDEEDEEDPYAHVDFPGVRRAFRGYNVEDIDNFLIPLVESYNEIQNARKQSDTRINDLTMEVASLLNEKEELEARVERLENFTLTDEIKHELHEAEQQSRKIIMEAKAQAKTIIKDSREKAKEIKNEAVLHNKELATKAREQRQEILNKSRAKAIEIKEKAHHDAEALIEKINTDLAEAKEYIAKRHEVHNKLQEFYKAQHQYLIDRG